MGALGKAKGIFDLENSDKCVGSFLSKKDIKSFMGINDSDLNCLKFRNIEGLEVIDERKLDKAWRKGDIPNAPTRNRRSLDELILKSIFHKALPNCIIETQVPVKIKRTYWVDFKITYEGKSIFIEFDGPSHFVPYRNDGEIKHPFNKKEMIEDKEGIEVVNWGYWVQRCELNLKVLFGKDSKGYGALFSTNTHFGDFVFENSAKIIETINNRFNLDRDGFGYFYGPNSAGRNNPEHPIIEKIRLGKTPIEKILPKGFIDKEKWLPNQLKY